MRTTIPLLSLALALVMSAIGAIPIWQANRDSLELVDRLSADEMTSPYECAIFQGQGLGPINPEGCRRVSFEITGDKVYLDLQGDKNFYISTKRPFASLILGSYALRDGRTENAIELWQSVANSEIYLLNLARKEQDPNTQIVLYELSVLVKPELITFVELSKSYAALRDYDAATQAANSAIDIFANKPTSDHYFLALVYQQAGHAYYSQKDYLDAKVRYDQALALWPDLPESITGLARIEMISGQYDSAIESLLSGLESVSNQYWINYWLAVAYRELGDSEESIRRLSLALEERSSFGTAWRLLGNIAEENGDQDMAIEAYQNYLVLFPDDIEVESNLRSLEGQLP